MQLLVCLVVVVVVVTDFGALSLTYYHVLSSYCEESKSIFRFKTKAGVLG